jgi:hypothetical protein
LEGDVMSLDFEEFAEAVAELRSLLVADGQEDQIHDETSPLQCPPAWDDLAFWDEETSEAIDDGEEVTPEDVWTQALRGALSTAKRNLLKAAWPQDLEAVLARISRASATPPRATAPSSAKSSRPSKGSKAKRPERAPAAAPGRTREKLERFWVPNQIFDVDLTHGEYRLYTYLCRRAGKSQVCWPGHGTIVKECRMNRKTLTEAVKALEARGMIETKRGAFGRSSKYYLMPAEKWRVTTPVEGAVTESVTAPVEGVVTR